MSDNTIASRVNRLLQKSRQAYRVYSAMGKSARSENNEFSALQAAEWKRINAELVNQLTKVIEKNSLRNLSQHVSHIRDLIDLDVQKVEREVIQEQKELVQSAERGDFIRAALLAKSLVSKKSFVQAAQAAKFELSLICHPGPAETKPQVSDTRSNEFGFVSFAPESSMAEIPEIANFDEELPDMDRMAKVIPLRR